MFKSSFPDVDLTDSSTGRKRFPSSVTRQSVLASRFTGTLPLAPRTRSILMLPIKPSSRNAPQNRGGGSVSVAPADPLRTVRTYQREGNRTQTDLGQLARSISRRRPRVLVERVWNARDFIPSRRFHFWRQGAVEKSIRQPLSSVAAWSIRKKRFHTVPPIRFGDDYKGIRQAVQSQGVLSPHRKQCPEKLVERSRHNWRLCRFLLLHYNKLTPPSTDGVDFTRYF